MCSNPEMTASRRRGPNPRLSLALLAGRVVGTAARLSGRGGGTALPGTVAQRLYPSLLADVASGLEQGVVLVSGTNGKTTTSRLLASMLTASGYQVLHNRSGSNLLRGIASSVVQSTHLGGRPAADVAVFETDEAVLPLLLREMCPRVLLLNNLFRDQLDRYGELDTLYRSWESAVSSLPAHVTLVVNVDDPALARLAEQARCKVLPFGLYAPEYALAELPHAADAAACARCRLPLQYTRVYVSHMGEYHCPNCGFSRPEPEVLATDLHLHGTEATQLTLREPGGAHELTLNVPGLYNVYNALAAAAGALALGTEWEAIAHGFAGFSAAFGRFERVRAEGREIAVILVKNPVGANEVLRMLVSDPLPEPVLLIINDRIADGRDVSWLWDADFELLACLPGPFITSGVRAADMALRLKYAGIPTERIEVVEDIPSALAEAVRRTREGGTLRVLPTYTAMLELRREMGELGWVQPYWEE
ncbi:MAG: MurT ligase domain-containing protein [Chloroflexota bacterium]|nr:MurT ligase domain-containing protein [Chloroflexota bacterium]